MAPRHSASLGLHSELKRYNAIAAWEEQIAKFHGNAVVFGNAARFFIPCDLDRAETYLKRAKALDPDNDEWPEQLAHVYSLRAKRHGQESRKRDDATKALAELDIAFGLSESEEDKYQLLDLLATAAVEAGELEKAGRYAMKLLKGAKECAANWHYGNAIFEGHTVLGRVALQKGDLESAKMHLLEAGKTPGSPQLDSFGPDMTLAKALLEKGEKAAVVRYLELCSTFWESGREALSEWRAQIADGKTPDLDWMEFRLKKPAGLEH
ncbi:MAG: hypothetical protein HY897_13380 [Deltaproteobacteria bacterium]|nr:hypothetical protein [Deltaproteobacteria bacterium]